MMNKIKYFLLLMIWSCLGIAFALTATCSKEPTRNYSCCSYKNAFGSVSNRWITSPGCPIPWMKYEGCNRDVLVYLNNSSQIDFSLKFDNDSISQYCSRNNKGDVVLGAVVVTPDLKATCFKEPERKYPCCIYNDAYGRVSRGLWLTNVFSCPVAQNWTVASSCKEDSLAYSNDLSKFDTQYAPAPSDFNISQYCLNKFVSSHSGGVVIDTTVRRICILPKLMGNGIKRSYTKPYTFVAWTYREGKEFLYASRSVEFVPESVYNRVIPSSTVESWTRDNSTYGWTTAEKDVYEILKTTSSSASSYVMWTVKKNGNTLSTNAKCMLYSDILGRDWHSEQVYQVLPSY